MAALRRRCLPCARYIGSIDDPPTHPPTHPVQHLVQTFLFSSIHSFIHPPTHPPLPLSLQAILDMVNARFPKDEEESNYIGMRKVTAAEYKVS